MRGLASAHLANSRAYLDCARAAAAGAQHSHRTALIRASLYLKRRLSGNSPPFSRRSDAVIVQAAVRTSEWDTEGILNSDRRSKDPSRREGKGSWGADRWGNTASEQPAASSSSGGSGWGDDWDLGSDRRTQKPAQRGGRGRWGNGRQSPDRGSWQGNRSSRGSWDGRSDASSGGSWGRDGGARPGRGRWGDSSAAVSEDSWSTSSRGGMGGGRGVSFTRPTLSLGEQSLNNSGSACTALELTDGHWLYHA